MTFLYCMHIDQGHCWHLLPRLCLHQANVKVKNCLLWCLALQGVNTTIEMNIIHFNESEHDITFTFTVCKRSLRYLILSFWHTNFWSFGAWLLWKSVSLMGNPGSATDAQSVCKSTTENNCTHLRDQL